MLPSFLPLDGAKVGTAVQVPPPPKFRPIVGTIRNVGVGGKRFSNHGSSPAQKAGLRYETRVHAELAGRFGYDYVEAPVFSFEDDLGRRSCVPDALLKRPSRIVLIEIKSQHMPEAWWQLRKLYEPVIRAAGNKDKKIILVEVCRSLDIQMPFPEEFENLSDLLPWVDEAEDGSLGVLRWTP